MTSHRAHGTRAKYCVEGCRCDACRAASTAGNRERRRSPLPAYVDASRARAHIADLRAGGLGVKAIARAAGISHGAISKLVYGDYTRGRGPSRRIRPETERRILGVTPRDGLDRSLVDAGPTQRHIARLLDRGWTKAGISRAIGGNSRSLQVADAARVRAETARAIEALLDQPVPPKVTRWGPRPVAQPEPDQAEKVAEIHYRQRIAGNLPRIGDALPDDWVHRAACRRRDDIPTWLFFASETDTETTARAKAVCDTCPVRTDCLNHAIRTEAEGIWGGLTASERTAIAAGQVAS